MAGKTVPAARLRGLLTKHLQMVAAMGDSRETRATIAELAARLAAVGDGDVPAEQMNAAQQSYQRALYAAQGTGGPTGPQTGSQGTSGAEGAGHTRGQVPIADEMAQRAAKVAADRAAALDAEDRALAERVAQVRTERAQQAALAKHPEVAPLIDLLEFNGDEAAYLESARELAAALGGESASEPVPPPAPPVMAGNPPLHQPSADERLEEVKARARSGDPAAWSEFFRIKEAQARGETLPNQ